MFRNILRRDLVAGTLKTRVQFWPAFTQRRDGVPDLFFTFADVRLMVSDESPALKEYTMESRETRVPAT
jgi:hypothetical protein